MSAPAPRPRLLVVDDEEHLRSTMAVLLGRDYEVRTAASAAEAEALLAEAPADLVVSDERMPGTLGTALLGRIRARWPDTIRFVLTAYSDPDAMLRAINDGEVHRFLLKPCDPGLLRQEVADALERRRLEVENRQMRDRLAETERVYALGVVAAGIAHELRNPLTILMGSLEIAALRAERVVNDLENGAAAPAVGDARELVRHLDLARRGVDQLVEITQGIEISNRRRDAERATDLAQIVRLTLRSVEGALRARARTVVEGVPVPPVCGSPTKLGQVVLNLLVNALQALPERSTREERVTVRYRPDGTWVRLEVEDTGPGIPSDLVARVFDPFFTTKHAGGTGLGLAISRRIVEEVGGTIDVRSAPNAGTTFSVLLPIASPDPGT